MNEGTLKTMFSSKTEMWATPLDFFNQVNQEFKFNTDVCAIKDNAKCEHFYSPEDNGLAQPWMGVCWMNPPYGADIKYWLDYAYKESLKGSIIVCLIPARTDTRYFHEICINASEIRFIKGRLKFGEGSNSAPFPSMLVIFNPYDISSNYPRLVPYDKNSIYDSIIQPGIYYPDGMSINAIEFID